MNEVERWLRGEAPSSEASGEAASASAEQQARAARRFFASLGAMERAESACGDSIEAGATPAERCRGEGSAVGEGATMRCPDLGLVRLAAGVREARRAPAPVAVLGVAAPAAPAPMKLLKTGAIKERSAKEWAEEGELPFRPAAPGRARAAKTLQTPVMRGDLAETAPLGDDSIARAVAALPFLGNTLGAGVIPFPRLTLEQYASLCAELWVRPAQRGEVLRRYHVLHEASLGALGAHWEGLFAEKGELRAAFERARGAYAGWLWGRSG